MEDWIDYFHTLVLLKIHWINETMISPQTSNQTKVKIKERKIQLNIRYPYAQHVKETLKLPEIWLSTKRDAKQLKTPMKTI